LERIPHIWHLREFSDLDYSYKFSFPKDLSLKIIKSSSAIICNSQAVCNHYFNPSVKNIHIIYNGIQTKDKFDSLYLQNKNIRHKHTFTFVMVGSISPNKGTEIAIKAISELTTIGFSCRLLIVGNGKKDYVEYCKHLCESLNLTDFVEFKGYMEDPYDAYFESDCLLMCSEFEAFGRVTAEAMSACLPVIGKNSGGTPEIIEHGITGILYNTFEDLVNGMVRMVENPVWGQKLGLAGWRRARNQFNIEDYSANVYQIIKSVTQ
jgi:glycosyltransferase involved in cell wall biosynthesis